MKIVGGIVFVLAAIAFLVFMHEGNTNLAIVACLVLPISLLVGYLGSRPYRNK